MDYLALAAAAAQNNAAHGATFDRAKLPAPLCFFDSGSAALAALVYQAQAHAGMAPTGVVCAETLAALQKGAKPKAAKSKAKGAKGKPKA